MKAPTLNLLILDKNSAIIGPLSNYLNTRFGERIAITAYADIDECAKNINHKSHVLILDYFLNHEDKTANKGLKVFDSIKKRNPRNKVTMFSSNEDIALATEEMQQGASKYIMKNERGLYDIIFKLDKVVVTPIKTVITLPIRTVMHYYNLKAYIMMFLVAFASVGLLVIGGFLALKFAHMLNI
jgi:ActR/RegA family two-component response regulator